MNTPDDLRRLMVDHSLIGVQIAIQRVSEQPDLPRVVEALNAILHLTDVTLTEYRTTLTAEEIEMCGKAQANLTELLYALELMDSLPPEMVEWLEGGDLNHRDPDLSGT
jgi:hypothetical protein